MELLQKRPVSTQSPRNMFTKSPKPPQRHRVSLSFAVHYIKTSEISADFIHVKRQSAAGDRLRVSRWRTDIILANVQTEPVHTEPVHFPMKSHSTESSYGLPKITWMPVGGGYKMELNGYILGIFHSLVVEKIVVLYDV